MDNIFDDIPADQPDEFASILADGEGVRIERIVSQGHASPPGFWYDQDEHEWVMVLGGTAQLEFADGRIVSLVAGDHLVIPAHQRHRVEWTSPEEPTIWLAVFYRDKVSG